MKIIIRKTTGFNGLRVLDEERRENVMASIILLAKHLGVCDADKTV